MDIGDSINSFTDYVLDNTIFSRLLSNAFGVSVMIMICIIVIVMLNFNEEITEHRTKSVRTAIYIFISVFICTLVYYHAVKRKTNNLVQDIQDNENLRNIEKIRNNTVPINPFTASATSVTSTAPAPTPAAPTIPAGLDITEQQFY